MRQGIPAHGLARSRFSGDCSGSAQWCAVLSRRIARESPQTKTAPVRGGISVAYRGRGIESRKPILPYLAGFCKPRLAADSCALSPGGCSSTGARSMPFATLALPFDPYAALPSPAHRWLLLCLARYADRAGTCYPSLRQLAADARMSLATVCRRMAELGRAGCFTRQRRAGGRYRYTLAEPYRLSWRPGVSAAQPGVSRRARQQAESTKQDRELPQESEAFRWRARLRQWRELGLWVASYGPRPSEPGCRAPAELLVPEQPQQPRGAIDGGRQAPAF